ncbi:MAG: AAA family ATPase [Pseudomonadota bacterium]
MGRSIAVMNTKGGVGKSTLVMAMAETLSAHHGRNVLVIDSDSQTSMSIMLMEMARWEQMERNKLTLVDFLSRSLLNDEPVDWKPHVATGVSDVEEARSVYLMPSHMQLSLFERMVSGEHKHTELRTLVRGFLADAKRYFDVVLIDCPPGLSVLTETWLRESDYFMPPVKPDYLSVRGLDILKRFRNESDAHGFAELIGTVINLKDGRIQAENHWHQHLASDPDNRCFSSVVPRRAYLQRAADYEPTMRTYIAKYPGDAGQSILNVVNEMLERIQQAELERQTAVIGGPVRPTPAPASVPSGTATGRDAAASSAHEQAAEPMAIIDSPIIQGATVAEQEVDGPAVDLGAPIGLEPLVADGENTAAQGAHAGGYANSAAEPAYLDPVRGSGARSSDSYNATRQSPPQTDGAHGSDRAGGYVSPTAAPTSLAPPAPGVGHPADFSDAGRASTVRPGRHAPRPGEPTWAHHGGADGQAGEPTHDAHTAAGVNGIHGGLGDVQDGGVAGNGHQGSRPAPQRPLGEDDYSAPPDRAIVAQGELPPRPPRTSEK